MSKVVLGFSGGVDSAVCSKLLKDAGHEVHGLYLDNAGEDARLDAVKTAEFIGIPLKIKDVHAELNNGVCKSFAEAYLNGETPNPCIICNP
ncbi:MAG TPA: tRNA 2-thiouridine(34) synthase MnmA, partial [Clostridiales bacterium]|nr:tRNA 2-thiouridine(34) synthase MnmA [Clostridiales bacterium]